jgi:hypothetical protein
VWLILTDWTLGRVLRVTKSLLLWLQKCALTGYPPSWDLPRPLRGWMPSESTSQVQVPHNLQYMPHKTYHAKSFEQFFLVAPPAPANQVPRGAFSRSVQRPSHGSSHQVDQPAPSSQSIAAQLGVRKAVRRRRSNKFREIGKSYR